MPAKELPPEIGQKEIEYGRLYQKAIKSNNYQEAEKMLLLVWGLYPEPKYLWSSSMSLIKGIFKFYLAQNNYLQAEFWARELFKCKLLENDPEPYIMLGKVYLESGREQLAAEELIKAYEMGGRRGYVGEDPKYLKFALDQMRKASK